MNTAASFIHRQRVETFGNVRVSQYISSWGDTQLLSKAVISACLPEM